MYKNLVMKTNEYFEAIVSKDLAALSEMYSDRISLVDWNGSWFRPDKVLEANKQLFQNDFELKVLDTTQSDNKTFNTIVIKINNEIVEILDIITFDDTFKIISIKAYKG
jgi:hypothetical protein